MDTDEVLAAASACLDLDLGALGGGGGGGGRALPAPGEAEARALGSPEELSNFMVQLQVRGLQGCLEKRYRMH